MAISMVLAGIQAVAMPLIVEFQFSREIEDRLLAPIAVGWIAVEKVMAGMAQAFIAGLVVIPAGWADWPRSEPGLLTAVPLHGRGLDRRPVCRLNGLDTGLQRRPDPNWP